MSCAFLRAGFLNHRFLGICACRLEDMKVLYLLFMFSPPKISWVISGIKYICLHLLPVFYLIQPSSKQFICFDFREQNSVLLIVYYLPWLEVSWRINRIITRKNCISPIYFVRCKWSIAKMFAPSKYLNKNYRQVFTRRWRQWVFDQSFWTFWIIRALIIISVSQLEIFVIFPLRVLQILERERVI